MLRNKRVRRGLTASLVALTLSFAALTGCSSGEAAPKSNVDQSLPALHSDLKNGHLVRTIPLPGEKFSVQTDYSSEYAAKDSWNITTNKSLTIALRLVSPVPAGTVVYVEHMHADCSIAATKASVNGMLQDSMDDSMHAGTEPGFLVTTTYPYEVVFSIEGYSETLISGWSYQNGSYGAGEVNQSRLTEDTLRDNGGATGSKFTIVYDLLVQYKDDVAPHKVSFADTFIVPVSTH